MKVKLKIFEKAKDDTKIDLAALKQPDLKEAYNIKVRNRFSALMGERENGENIENPIERINCKWNYLQEAINAAQEKALPKKKREAKQAGITEEILQKMKERKKYKGTVTYTKLDRRSKETALRQKRYGQTKNVKRLKDSPKN